MTMIATLDESTSPATRGGPEGPQWKPDLAMVAPPLRGLEVGRPLA